MKVLLTGSGSFRDNMIRRLKREKHDVYTVTGKGDMMSGTINYAFDLSDNKLPFIVSSIMPDAVVFTGALDENYDFTSEQAASMDYLAGLSNLLITMSSLSIRRLVYISASTIYGTGLGAPLSETSEKKPEDVKSLTIAAGESMCFDYNKSKRMQCVSLRFSEVYGLLSDNLPDLYEALFSEYWKAGLESGDLFLREIFPEEDKLISPIYVSDAVDAVYKALTTVHDGELFNVSGCPVKLSEAYKKVHMLCTIDRVYNATHVTMKEKDLAKKKQ